MGLSMLIASVLSGVLLLVTPKELAAALATEWRDVAFGTAGWYDRLGKTTPWLVVTLSSLLIFVNALGQIMQEIGLSGRIAPAMQRLFRSRRLALAAIPALMGLLPTPGGIMLSAPLIKTPGEQMGVSNSRLAAINFFFRHVWESVWPLFPAVPLIQGLVGVSAWQIFRYNVVILIVAVISGVIFMLLPALPGERQQFTQKASYRESIKTFMQALWPIILTATLWVTLGLPPVVGILISIFILIFAYRIPSPRAKEIFKATCKPDHFLLVLGALMFRLNLNAADAVQVIAKFLTDAHMPVIAIIFILPFIVGFLTGLSMPAVATTVPLLLVFIGTGDEAILALERLAYAGVICGWLISPIHLCFALSMSYFKAPYLRLLAWVIGPVICIAAVTLYLAWRAQT
ncbi:MAG: DUF401 family protein [Sedimentisphaerales bacterium]|nr:DUF401 family protein [Sedimentisphaerales bacterium]